MIYRRSPRKSRQCKCCSRQSGESLDEIVASETNEFGQKGGYWEMHNELTDKYDEDMMERLNSGLDNLLIFVSHTMVY